MEFVRNVTWKEIRKAERLREKEMEFELEDIFESAKLYGRDLERRLEENVEYVLKREGLLDPEEMHVSIAPADLYWECDEEEGDCRYSANFAIFDKTGNNIIAYGTVYGSGHYFPEEDETELLYITVAMPTRFVKKLKRMVETLKHVIWRGR